MAPVPRCLLIDSYFFGWPGSQRKAVPSRVMELFKKITYSMAHSTVQLHRVDNSPFLHFQFSGDTMMAG